MPAPITAPCPMCGAKLVHDERLSLDTNASCVECHHRVKI